jgi:uncharacterized membrane protein
MAQTATRRSASKAKPKGKGKAKPKARSNGKGTDASAKKAAGSAAAKAALTTRPGGPVRPKMAGAAIKAAAKKAGDRAKQTLPALAGGSRQALAKVREASLDKVRTLPVQRSLDVAVPVEAAWDEWMRFDWLPDGAHRVQDIERDGDRLFGRLSGHWTSGDWEAEIVDEREDESLAWQTVEGSDTSGLVTFHRLSDRLTRLELQLDIVPEGIGEALSLVVRQADRRADKVMRSFKAQVEALDPDEYPPLAEVEEEATDEDEDDDDAVDDDE